MTGSRRANDDTESHFLTVDPKASTAYALLNPDRAILPTSIAFDPTEDG